MRVVIVGPVGDGGYGTTTHELSRSLIKRGVDLKILATALPANTQFIDPVVAKRFIGQEELDPLLKDPAVHVIHHTYPGGYSFGNRGIVLTTHETEAMPTIWANRANQARAVILNTDWLKRSMEKQGAITKPMYVLPHGVSSDSDPEFHEPNDNIFTFLVLDKVADTCIDGFLKAFGEDITVRLIVKIRKNTCYFNKDRALPSNIKVMSQDFIPSYQIDAMHYSSHCLLHPVEGAGWALPISESLARGIPVIANRKNGITEYTKPGDLLETPGYEEKPFKFEPWVPDGLANTEWGTKYYPTADGIAEACLEMRKNYTFWKTKAMECSRYLKENYTWDIAAIKLINILEKL